MAFSINPGVWPVMITPWTEDNKPDFKAIKQLCDWYVEKGCTGIFAVCQSSEMAYLTEQEKLDMAPLFLPLKYIRPSITSAAWSNCKTAYSFPSASSSCSPCWWTPCFGR